MYKNFINCLDEIREQVQTVEMDSDVAELVIQKIVASRLPVICTGIGKSGYVMQKFTASLNSIGVRAIFLDPLNALHGDIGIIAPESLLLLMSNSGNSSEMLSIVKALKNRNISSVLFTSGDGGNLNRDVDFIMKYSFSYEAGQANLAPTTSSTLQMLLVDSLIASLTYRMNLTEVLFASNHPSGSLGRRLKNVEELMKPVEQIASVEGTAGVIDAIRSMNKFHVGACCIVNKTGVFRGLITDGDIRRLLETTELINQSVMEVMNTKPATVFIGTRYSSVLSDPAMQTLNCIPVLDANDKLNGLLVQSEVNI